MIIFISPCRIILYFRSGMSSFQTYSHTRFPHPFAVTCSALYAQCPAPKPLSSHFTTFTPWSYFTGSFPSGPDIPRYRYFFNGQEADNEVYGEEAVLGYEFRQYDARIGRFWSVAPLAGKFPWNSPYAFAENDVVRAIDLESKEKLIVIVGTNKDGTKVKVTRDQEISDFARNAATLGVTVRYPNIVSAVGSVKRGGTNISSISGRIARHVAENGNMTTGVGSERNGFRHALWSATIANKYGDKISERISNAHEGIPILESGYVDFSMPLVQNGNVADEIVDFLNNQIGREIAASLQGVTNQINIAKEVLNVYHQQGLWVVNKNENETLSISKHKISEEQYNKAIKKLKTLDENGMNQTDRETLRKK